MPIPWIAKTPLDRFLETMGKTPAEPVSTPRVSWVKPIEPLEDTATAPTMAKEAILPLGQTDTMVKSPASVLAEYNKQKADAMRAAVATMPAVTDDDSKDELVKVEPSEKVEWWKKALDTINAPFEWAGQQLYRLGKLATDTSARDREEAWLANKASGGRTAEFDELNLAERLAFFMGYMKLSPDIQTSYHELPLWSQILFELPAGLAIPGVGAVAKGLGAASKIGGAAGKALGLASKALKPLAAAEELPGKLIGKAASKVFKRGTKLADLDDIGTVIDVATKPDFARTLANIPAFKPFAQFLGGKAATARTPAQKAIVGYLAQKPEIENKVLTAMSNVMRIGNAETVWGRGADDLITVAGKEGAEGIVGKSLHDVLSDKDWTIKYAPYMTEQQIQWANAYREISDLVAPMLEKNGIPVREMKDYLWTGRKVMARVGKEGEIDDIAFIGSGPTRPGGKIGELKQRHYQTVEEAAKDGFVYLAPEDSLWLNLRATYNIISQKRMKEWLLERVDWRSIKTPEELKAFVKAKGDDVIEQIGKQVTTNPQDAKTLKYLATAINRSDKKRINMLIDRLPPQLKSSIRSQYDDWQSALEHQRKTSDFLRKGHFGEASVPYPLFADVRFTGADAKDITKTLMDGMESNWNKALHEVNKVNAVTRMFALAGDASVFGIQLLPIAAYKPKVYGQAIKGFVNAFLDPNYHINLIAKNADVINNSPGMVMAYRGFTEATEAMRDNGLLGATVKVAGKTVTPGEVLAKPLKPFARGFEAALDTAGIELRKALNHLTLNADGTTNPERLNQVISFINEVRGVFNSGRLGISTAQRQLETATMLAPQYMRAMTALMTDVVRGGIRGNEARKALGSMLASLTSLSVGIDLATGKTPEEAAEHLNPASADWLTWRIAGQNVGFGTKARGIIQLLARSASDPEKLASLTMSNPLLRFFRYSMSPVLSTGIDVLSGKNALGEPTRENLLQLTDNVVFENMVPIWMQSMVSEGGSVTGRLVRGASEFGGLRTYEMVNYQKRDELRAEYATADYGKKYDELSVVEKKLMEMAHPDLADYTEKAWLDSKSTATGTYADYYAWKDERKAVNDEYVRSMWDLQSQYEDGVKTAMQVKESLQKLSTWRSKNFKQIDIRYPDVISRLEATTANKEEHPSDYAYDKWIEMFMDEELTLGTDLFDWEEHERRKQEYLATFGQEMWDYAEQRNQLGLDVPPIVKEYRKAMNVLEPYWQIQTDANRYFPKETRAKERFIARRKKVLRRLDKQVDYYVRLFYTREGV